MDEKVLYDKIVNIDVSTPPNRQETMRLCSKRYNHDLDEIKAIVRPGFHVKFVCDFCIVVVIKEVYELIITIPDDYPFRPPSIVLKNCPNFNQLPQHWNVNVNGQIDTGKWNPSLTICELLQVIEETIYAPIHNTTRRYLELINIRLKKRTNKSTHNTRHMQGQHI
jgi:hypothetical protein